MSPSNKQKFIPASNVVTKEPSEFTLVFFHRDQVIRVVPENETEAQTLRILSQQFKVSLVSLDWESSITMYRTMGGVESSAFIRELEAWG